MRTNTPSPGWITLGIVCIVVVGLGGFALGRATKETETDRQLRAKRETDERLRAMQGDPSVDFATAFEMEGRRQEQLRQEREKKMTPEQRKQRDIDDNRHAPDEYYWPNGKPKK